MSKDKQTALELRGARSCETNYYSTFSRERLLDCISKFESAIASKSVGPSATKIVRNGLRRCYAFDTLRKGGRWN
jgi:hypothetical protein